MIVFKQREIQALEYLLHLWQNEAYFQTEDLLRSFFTEELGRDFYDRHYVREGANNYPARRFERFLRLEKDPQLVQRALEQILLWVDDILSCSEILQRDSEKNLQRRQAVEFEYCVLQGLVERCSQEVQRLEEGPVLALKELKKIIRSSSLEKEQRELIIYRLEEIQRAYQAETYLAVIVLLENLLMLFENIAVDNSISFYQEKNTLSELADHGTELDASLALLHCDLVFSKIKAVMI